MAGASILTGCRGATDTRPNVVLLLADDLRHDVFSFAGHPVSRTPAIDDLAGDGILFPDAFVTTSICAISRASLVLGQWAGRHGIADFGTGLSAAQEKLSAPFLLRESGYHTGFLGKYGIGWKLPPSTPYHVCECFGGQGDYYRPDDERHLTARLAESATRFIRGAPRGRPFFLTVSFKAPHAQGRNAFLPDHGLASLYDDAAIERVPTDTAEHYAALHPALAGEHEGRTRYLERFGDDQRLRTTRLNYLRLVAGLDRAVGRIREAIVNAGESARTIVIFTSDNGFFLGEHGMAGKWLPFEPSIRVPLIVHDPRLAGRQRRRQMALNVDLAPTLLDWAEIDAPRAMQGRSLRQALTDPAAMLRDDWFYEHHYQPKASYIPASTAVRGTRYKYIRWHGEQAGESLFDLEADPRETRDLAQSPEAATLLTELRARHDLLQEETSRPA
ncbi:hypothetical protein ABI59_16255 [Acidobacteria bacterium Mor1]|nr:hypothetical protein ABI59_16255 [Acidobacteria bacterium Mor1]